MVHHFRGKLIARGDANRGGRSRSISKSKRCCCCTTFVPVASSLCTDFWDGMITLYMLVAACLHAPIYPSMDAGLIVNINYEVLDVYRARPTVIFGSVMWNITGEKGFLSFSLPPSLSFSLFLVSRVKISQSFWIYINRRNVWQVFKQMRSTLWKFIRLAP